jgi:hypothetical protein
MLIIKHKTKDGVTRTPLKMENSEIVITQYPGHDLHEKEWEGLSSDYVRFLKSLAIVLSVLRYTDSDYLPLVSSNSSWYTHIFGETMQMENNKIVSQHYPGNNIHGNEGEGLSMITCGMDYQ